MLLHWLGTVAITGAVLVSVGLAGTAWRLSQGPMDLPWLTARLQDAINANSGPTKLTIGSVALAWEGFRRGVERPLDFRLTNVTVADQSGGRHVSIPSAEVSLSMYQLLRGRVALGSVEVDQPRLTLIRAADGTLGIDVGSPVESTDNTEASAATPVADLLAELAQPARTDRDRRNTLFGQLREVRVHDARVSMIDQGLGVTWRAPKAEIDLVRQPGGGVEGTAELTLALADQEAHLALSATLAAGGAETHVRARTTPISPGALARAAPSFAALSALDAPVGGNASFDLDRKLALQEARFDLHAGAGTAHIGQGSVPFLSAVLVGSATPDAISVRTLRVTLHGHATGPDTHLETRGTVQREAGRTSAAFSADLDQVDFADLPTLWPEGVARDARDWLLENITAGTAHDGHVDVGLEASPDLSDVVLTRATGTLDGDGLQVHWLRPVPPIDNGRARLRIIDPDTLEIAVSAGRQEPRKGSTALLVRDGRMRITGIMRAQQMGVIDADISGSVPDALGLLREPRLGLLDRHPIDLKDPTGRANVKVAVALPLDKNVTMDGVAIHAQARLDNLHLSSVVAGHDLDDGVFDLDANADGMKLNGSASLALVPATVDASMDFRAGPPTQALQTVTVAGQADAAQLAAVGLDATSVLSGRMQLSATLTERRNGTGDVAVASDLTASELTVAALEWHKSSGIAAKATARVLLDHDRLMRLDSVQLDGAGVSLRGRGSFSGGKLAQMQLDRLVLGRTVAQATVRLPENSASPIEVNCSGSVLDLAQRMERSTPPRKAAEVEPSPGPPWVLDAKFDRVLMAHGAALDGVSVHAVNNGRVFRQLRLEGRTGTQGPIQLQIMPDGGGRRLMVNAVDAGELLRGLDVMQTMQGGRLSVEGHYEDAQPGQPLVGTANIHDFRIQNAPALGKLLQAMTLYGVVEVMRGPGLGFTRMEVPFRLTDDSLQIDDARAFSSSLGLTAKGTVDLDAQQIDMQGTIVPAYFFNSLLGNIPLVGKLFSPERGGGVFAASYSVSGTVDNPQVSVNPLAALTPGFLRGLFRLF